MIVTDNVFNRINKIHQDNDNDVPSGTHLRVYVEGGGCSGFQYGFKLTNEVSDEDFVVEQGDIKILIDFLSHQYLNEATLDFQSDLQGEMFVIKNPAARTTCGCGSSFTV